MMTGELMSLAAWRMAFMVEVEVQLEVELGAIHHLETKQENQSVWKVSWNKSSVK